ncbi:MAG TPA: pitrilysin family protein [Thermoanaerobaculia bacterium]|nr:pitrilysin family protein [Thermoanaerobaculia bacterium]
MRFALRTIILSAAAISAFAQTAPPPPGPSRPINWPAIAESKLGNGMTVVLVPLHNVPKITAVLTLLAGRGTAYKTQPGVAQLAARVANEGTTTRTSLQIKQDLRSIGGALSIGVDNDATSMTASSLAEFAPKLLDLVSDVVRHPTYPQSEVALAKANYAQEIEEQRSTPDFLAQEQLDKALFGAHPYGFTVPPPAAIRKVTRDALKSFAAAWYVPNNAILVIVGDFDAASMHSDVERSFGSWKRAPLPPEPKLVLPVRQKRQIYVIDRPGSVQSTILIGAPAPQRRSPDYIPLRTANMIYGGAFYSRLTRNIREGKGYTYSPFSTADLRRAAGAFEAGASVRNEVTGPTILEMLYELDRMRVEPVTAEELESAKTYSIGGMELELEAQASLATRISTIYVDELSRDFLQTFRDHVTALTTADIQHSAARYFDTYRGAIVVVGDYKQIKDQIAPFGDVKMVKQ